MNEIIEIYKHSKMMEKNKTNKSRETSKMSESN